MLQDIMKAELEKQEGITVEVKEEGSNDGESRPAFLDMIEEEKKEEVKEEIKEEVKKKIKEEVKEEVKKKINKKVKSHSI